MSPRLPLACSLALLLVAFAVPDARAEMGCAEGQNIDVVPSTTLDPDDASLNEMSQILFCTDDTPNTETAIASVVPTSDPDFSDPGWAYTFDPHEVSVNPGFVPGQMRYDVLIASHYNTVGNPAADSVNVRVTFTAFAPSDSGIENFAHTGSIVPGEVGTYSFDLVNEGPLDPHEHTFGLQVLDPAAQIEGAPAACDPPTAGTISCSADSLSPGAVHHVSFTVRNGTASADAYALFDAPWASEPDEEDGGHPNFAQLQLALAPQAPPPPGSGQTPPIPARPKALTVTLPKHLFAGALKKGWPIRVEAPWAGKLKLVLKVGSVTIATGTGRARDGEIATIRLKATKSAAKHLGGYAHRHARLTITEGKTRATRGLTLH